MRDKKTKLCNSKCEGYEGEKTHINRENKCKRYGHTTQVICHHIGSMGEGRSSVGGKIKVETKGECSYLLKDSFPRISIT